MRKRKGLEEGYSLAWWAVFMAVLLMPLGGLAIEMPRYLAFKAALQTLADASAEAGAHLGFDTQHFYSTGEVRLNPEWATQAAMTTLTSNLSLVRSGTLTSVEVSVQGDRIFVVLTARMNLFFPGVPSFPVRAVATSQARTSLR